MLHEEGKQFSTIEKFSLPSGDDPLVIETRIKVEIKLVLCLGNLFIFW